MRAKLPWMQLPGLRIWTARVADVRADATEHMWRVYQSDGVNTIGPVLGSYGPEITGVEAAKAAAEEAALPEIKALIKRREAELAELRKALG